MYIYIYTHAYIHTCLHLLRQVPDLAPPALRGQVRRHPARRDHGPAAAAEGPITFIPLLLALIYIYIYIYIYTYIHLSLFIYIYI